MRLRADVILALCALLISSLACLASVWQTHIIGQQLSAAVWPYLSFTTSSTVNRGKSNNPDEFSLAVTNDGLGPAIIESQVLTVDGRRVADPDEAIVMIAHTPLAKIAGHTSSSTLVPGTVIRPGASVTLLDVRGPSAGAAFKQRAESGADVTICYCSILRTCWIVRVRAAQHEVASCPQG